MCISRSLDLERGITSQRRMRWGSVRETGLGMRPVRLKRVSWGIGLGQVWIKLEGSGRDSIQCSSAEHQIAQ